MGSNLDRLVALTRVYVPPHVRVRDGNRQDVDGYWREVTVDSPLSNDEANAIKAKASKLLGPDLKAGMRAPSVKVARRQAEIDAVNKAAPDVPDEFRLPPSARKLVDRFGMVEADFKPPKKDWSGSSRPALKGKGSWSIADAPEGSSGVQVTFNDPEGGTWEMPRTFAKTDEAKRYTDVYEVELRRAELKDPEGSRSEHIAGALWVADRVTNRVIR